eukprot:6185364-Pleurochrysis_carterae.AAC.3
MRHGQAPERPRCACAQRRRACACPIGLDIKLYDTYATVVALTQYKTQGILDMHTDTTTWNVTDSTEGNK